ncbi:hypothetical protein BDN71DRAFT_1512940 [Pleurotus eryngii]|uniref:Uncharacterized protein n=1 Tax=Pleurotus eryngii TaxID=5323 RepID=A0A9P5ZIV8_PLEER|nr:hypothetical protein BDN71DRAFT_1512940 [Pleurotus eryngii]
MDWEPSPAVADPAAVPATPFAVPNVPPMYWHPAPAHSMPHTHWFPPSTSYTWDPSPYVENPAPPASNPMEGVTTDGPSPVMNPGTTTTPTTAPTAPSMDWDPSPGVMDLGAVPMMPGSSGVSSSTNHPPPSPARSRTPMEGVMNAAAGSPPPDPPMQNHSDQGTSHPATNRWPSDSYSPPVDPCPPKHSSMPPPGPMDWDPAEFNLGGHYDTGKPSEQGFPRRSRNLIIIAVREIISLVVHHHRLRLDRKMVPMLTMCLLTSNQHRISPGVRIVVRRAPGLMSQDPHEHTNREIALRETPGPVIHHHHEQADREAALREMPGPVVHHHREQASGGNMIVLVVLELPNNQICLQEIIGAIRHDPIAAGALRLHETTMATLTTETREVVDEHST